MSTMEASEFNPNIEWFDGTYKTGSEYPVAVFDFDGVICSPLENLVYQLDEYPNEKDFLGEMAKRYKLDVSLYDVRYLRHLVVQELLAERGEMPTEGPAFKLAYELSCQNRPFFILTARSGHAAINRALSFIEQNSLCPQEVFFIGRVPKGRQLRLIRKMAPESRAIVYFEDSKNHVKNSRKQNLGHFKTIYLRWDSLQSGKARSFYESIRQSGGAQAFIHNAA